MDVSISGLTRKAQGIIVELFLPAQRRDCYHLPALLDRASTTSSILYLRVPHLHLHPPPTPTLTSTPTKSPWPGSRLTVRPLASSWLVHLQAQPEQKAKLGLVKHVLSYTPLQGCKGPDPIRSQPSDGISPLPPRTNNFCNSTDPTYSTCTYHDAWLPQPFAPGRSRDHCHALESATSSGFRWMPRMCILIWRRRLDRCEETKTAAVSETSCVS